MLPKREADQIARSDLGLRDQRNPEGEAKDGRIYRTTWFDSTQLKKNSKLDRRKRKKLEKRNGAQRRNRTTDTGIFNPLLYRLSYLGQAGRSRIKPVGLAIVNTDCAFRSNIDPPGMCAGDLLLKTARC